MEGQEAKVPTVGIKPSQGEIEKHNACHIPFRNWCPFCVAGKAKDNPHRGIESEVSGVSLVTIDYNMFLHDQEDDRGGVPEDVAAEGEPDDGDADDEGDEVGLADNRSMPVLVSRDRRTQYVAARVAPHKGAHPYTVRRLGQDIKSDPRLQEGGTQE